MTNHFSKTNDKILLNYPNVENIFLFYKATVVKPTFRNSLQSTFHYPKNRDRSRQRHTSTDQICYSMN